MQRYAQLAPLFATITCALLISSGALAATTVSLDVVPSGGWLKTSLSIPSMPSIRSATTPSALGSIVADITMETDADGNPIITSAQVIDGHLDMSDSTFNLSGLAISVTTNAANVGATTIQHEAVHPGTLASGAQPVPMVGTKLVLNRGTVHTKGTALFLPVDLKRDLSTDPVTGEFGPDATASAKLTAVEGGYEIELMVPLSMQLDVLSVPARVVFGIEGELTFSGFIPTAR